MEHETQMMDLFEATQKMGYFNESDAKSILKQVYQGTTHCLSVGILHRDIKDENVLVNIQTREVCTNINCEMARLRLSSENQNFSRQKFFCPQSFFCYFGKFNF